MSGALRRAAIAAAIVTMLAASAATASASVGRWDREYVLGTIQGARFEIASGHVALRHSHSARVRSLAGRFVSDHAAELKQVRALARQLGIKIPAGLAVAQRHRISRFSSHTGAAFDRAYVRVERADHVQDVKDTDSEVMEGSTPEVRAFAQKFLPMYREHLSLTRSAAHVLKVG